MLTERQRADFLQAISLYTTRHGYPPSLPELAKEFGISYHAVWSRCHVLEKQGLIARDPYVARSIRVVKR